MTAQLLEPDEPGLRRAGALLRDGALVAFPTETVYGLGVRADDDAAVARLYAAKGRPSFNPLIVHLTDVAAAEALVVFDDDARALARAFWPGALTLVLPLREGAPVSPLVTAGLTTLAVRVPDHPVAAGVLAQAGLPVAAPSANPSGQVSPTTAAHVTAGLGEQIGAVVDGGACAVGVESTIIGPGPVLLRPGGLPLEAVEACLGRLVPHGGGDHGAPASPGQLASHYAPRGAVRLNVTKPEPGETLLGFGPVEGAALSLSRTGDLVEAAAGLFAALHQLNEMGAERIAVSPVPDQGLGRAINDRLRRAAAPREGRP